MSPDSPDACEGSCQNGLSSKRPNILPTHCFTAVLHTPSGCIHTVNQLYTIPTTLAPYLTAQWTRDQFQHCPRPSEVRAAEHRDPGRPARLGTHYGPQTTGAYYRAWCAPTNQSPEPITSLISHHPTLTHIPRIASPTPQPHAHRKRSATSRPSHTRPTQ